jgi:iron complex transport system ATP-binding protein
VARALDLAGIRGLADRPITELSGGEFQQATVARALAQEPRLLLLDEPTAFLDPAHSVRVLGLLERLNADGLTVLAVFHDLNLAAAYCRQVVAVRNGTLFAAGPTEEVMRADVLQELYGTPLVVQEGPHGKPTVTLLKAGEGGEG